jgi:hypothetical protein
MADPAHPFLRRQSGPWLAAAAVVFNGTLLAYFVALPLCLTLRPSASLPARRILAVFSFAGVLASQLVRVVQAFRQPGLRDFAVSWKAPLFGCLCGLAAGVCFVFFARRRFSPLARAVAYALPAAVVIACGGALVCFGR